MEIVKKKVTILSQNRIAPGIYDMRILCPEAAAQAAPGQFLALYSNDGTKLLPRPISICDYEEEKGVIRMVYRIAGGGTKQFAAMQAGDTLEIMGPLGNGFDRKEGRPAILVGGGIGIPPILALAKRLQAPKTVVLGYRDAGLFLKDEFEPFADVKVATEDGSCGAKGTVLDAIREEGVRGDVIYACGPMPMLKALAAYADEQGLEAQISLEERMACGIGACLGCVCRTREKDAHTNVHNKRICKEGPVFDAKEVVFR